VRTRLAFFITLMMLLVLTLFGCSGPKATSGTPDGAQAGADEPGIHSVRGGRSRVVGTLMTSDLEGGFVGVRLRRPEDSQNATTVVITNSGALPDVKRALDEGWTYVVVTGTMMDGVSVRMAGPEIVADTIEKMSPSTKP